MRGQIVNSISPWLLLFSLLFCSATIAADTDNPPTTGPATEKRFPPLKVPAGFKATLFACDPLIEYPSAISVGPRPGAIFVAVDYMTGLGTDIVRRSEVRLVEDTNADGYADKATVFADGFNSIMGLAWHDNTLFVMHAPFLTAVRDNKGTGMADERKDLLTGLGLTPEENPVRLHCANGVTVGHDGWLYLSLGDHGCIVQRPEGDRLVFEGGGILRCRADGRDLHVFATGLRNIYDVALDAELNVFVRDNENDGGIYKIRVCHSFFGADHGYPYLYYERPDEALRPLADLGLGSSAGAVCYLEPHFPAEYRGNLFLCEWGKSLVRYPLSRDKSSFARHGETEFAVSAEGDPYGFKPTDVVVQSDGTLMVSDYADGQRPKRGRGRIYKIATAEPSPELKTPMNSDSIAMLDSESYFERCQAQAVIEREGPNGLAKVIAAYRSLGERGRLHAVWIMVHVLGRDALDPLFALATSDPLPAVRAQAVRAIADLADPVLVHHRLDATAIEPNLPARLATLAKGNDPKVLLEIVIALRRSRWSSTPDWLRNYLTGPDQALAHAAMQALRSARNWPAVLTWLDAPQSDPLRDIALRAFARQYDPELVDGLLARLVSEQDAARKIQYADCLARVYKKPAAWTYWGYRPPPRPANSVAWEKTEAIAQVMNAELAKADLLARGSLLELMHREKVNAGIEVGKLLVEDRDTRRVSKILEILRDQSNAMVWRYLDPVIRDPAQSLENRLAAVALYSQHIGPGDSDAILALAQGLEDGPVLAEVLRTLSKYPVPSVHKLFGSKLNSANPEVRAAAIETLGNLQSPEGRAAVGRLLTDEDPRVRRAAAEAAGKLLERGSTDMLLKLAEDSDVQVRRASLDSLRQLKESRSLPLVLAALGNRQTEQVALKSLRELGGPAQAEALASFAKHNPSLEVLTSMAQTLTSWRDRSETTENERQQLDNAIAEVQGASGTLVRWRSGDVKGSQSDEPRDKTPFQFATGVEGRLVLAPAGSERGRSYQAATDIGVAQPTDVEFLGSSGGGLEVVLNGKSIHRRKEPQNFRIDSDRFAATLVGGINTLVVHVTTDSTTAPVEFHLRLRPKSAVAEHEKLVQAVLARSGAVERGKAIFLDREKSQCLKCHQLGDQGERTGPELTGLGSRFSRIYIAESILQPSRTIAPSFGTVVLELTSGKLLSGVKVAETTTIITLVDNQGNKQEVAKSEIAEQTNSPLSTMPEGLEKRLTEEEFVNLIAFLASLKETK
jgi:putative membrane-bound dehydrogenase-like protein